MTYKKANAEVVDFRNNEFFMAMSHNAALQWIKSNCPNWNGTIHVNGKFECDPFTDSGDGTFSHSGNSDNWFCLSYS